MSARCPSAILTRELWRTRGLWLYKTWKLHRIPRATLWGHKGKIGNTWGSVLLGLMNLWAHSLLVNIKIKSRNLKLRKKKRNSSSTISYWNQPRSLKQRKLGGGRWPDYLALWLAVCSEISTLKGMPLWNGCLSNQNLNQIIALQKKKKGKRKTVKVYTALRPE